MEISFGIYQIYDYMHVFIIPMSSASCHNANFVITGGTGGCHKDNLQCHQWWQSWHHNNSRFSVFIFIKYVTHKIYSPNHEKYFLFQNRIKMPTKSTLLVFQVNNATLLCITLMENDHVGPNATLSTSLKVLCSRFFLCSVKRQISPQVALVKEARTTLVPEWYLAQGPHVRCIGFQ